MYCTVFFHLELLESLLLFICLWGSRVRLFLGTKIRSKSIERKHIRTVYHMDIFSSLLFASPITDAKSAAFLPSRTSPHYTEKPSLCTMVRFITGRSLHQWLHVTGWTWRIQAWFHLPLPLHGVQLTASMFRHSKQKGLSGYRNNIRPWPQSFYSTRRLSSFGKWRQVIR